MNLSHWEQESFFKNIDYTILGSGIVGLNAALTLKLKEPTAKVIVIERGPVPSGASTRNAGFACFGSVSELLDDLCTASKEEVLELVELRWKGLQKLRSLLGDKEIDYVEYGSYELFKTEKNFLDCAKKIDELNKEIAPISGLNETFVVADKNLKDFHFHGIKHLIKNNAEGQIHTGKMMSRLLHLVRNEGIEIYNGIHIKEINDRGTFVELLTDQNWRIKTRNTIVATNGFAKELLPQLTVKPARNQVLITKPIQDLVIKGCFHFDKGYVYFRNVGNRVLLGGARNQSLVAEETDKFGFTNKIQQHLITLLKTHILPNKTFEIDCWWSGIMGVGNIKKPIVKKISNRITVAVRLGGMGVAIGSLTGEQAACIHLGE